MPDKKPDWSEESPFSPEHRARTITSLLIILGVIAAASAIACTLAVALDDKNQSPTVKFSEKSNPAVEIVGHNPTELTLADQPPEAAIA